jgi:hypothetical protein
VGVSSLILGLGFGLGWWLILWLQQEFVAEVMNICSSDLCEMCRESILDGCYGEVLEGVGCYCLFVVFSDFLCCSLDTKEKINNSYCLFLYIFCIPTFIETMVDYGYGGILFSSFLELEVVASTFVTILYCFGC